MGGRILAIGDVHGCDTALAALLDQIQPALDDTVVFLGDLIDRGPDSRGVIDRIINLKRDSAVINILGNHDEWLLESLDREEPRLTWIAAGGLATLKSYGGDLKNIPQSHIKFLRAMVEFWQTTSHIFVHASVDPTLPLEQQPMDWLRWNALTGDEVPHNSGKIVVCGHTSIASGLPAHGKGYVCIDTKAHAGQWLTCLDTESNLFWQANQRGEHRGPLSLESDGTEWSKAEF